MFIKCRNIGIKIFSVINRINNTNVVLSEFNLPSKNIFINGRICYRYFCQANEYTEKLDYDLITNGDKELEHKLKILELELDVMKQEGLRVPTVSAISVEHWQELLTLPSRSARMKLYHFLFTRMKARESDKQKKLEKAKKREEKEKEVIPKDLPIEEFAHIYQLGYNHIFLRFRETTMNQFYNNRLIQAIRFGEKLVIDCGYDSYMTKQESVNCAKQIMLLFADNRIHDEPFDLHLCNVNKEGIFMKYIHKFFPPLYEPSFPLNVHEASYLDMFPKDNLIYLTPHCNEIMNEYDPDKTYIVGGIVDKKNQEPLSLAKAKKEGLKMAKLPFDKYLDWGLGGKSLALNQITSILLDIKKTGDWNLALKHVPSRKLIKENSVFRPNFPSPAQTRVSPQFRKPMRQTQSISDSLRFGNSPTNYKELRNKGKIVLRDVINE